MDENEMKVKALFTLKRAFCMQKTAPIARTDISLIKSLRKGPIPSGSVAGKILIR